MSRDQSKLNPLVQILARAFVEECKKQGYNVQITDCVRSKDEQNSLPPSVTQVKYPYSFHNWGVAFDICQGVKGDAYPTDPKWWKNVGAIGERFGFEWGGRWTKFIDRPHFQLNAYGNCGEMVKKYGTPEKLFKTTDWNVVKPKLKITPSSQFRKIIWLQGMLCIKGFPVTIDGIWGQQTINAVKMFWEQYGKTVKGKTCSTNMIKKLTE